MGNCVSVNDAATVPGSARGNSGVSLKRKSPSQAEPACQVLVEPSAKSAVFGGKLRDRQDSDSESCSAVSSAGEPLPLKAQTASAGLKDNHAPRRKTELPMRGPVLSLQTAVSTPGDRDMLPDPNTLAGPSGQRLADAKLTRHQSLDLSSLSSRAGDNAELQLGLQEEPPDPAIDHILGLTLSIFRLDSVMLLLLERDRLFVKGGPGIPANLRYTACHLLTGGPDSTVVLEDTLSDSRVASCPEVAEHIRFFAAKELLAVNKFKLGYLCVCHSRPKEFTAMNRMILGNMADLLTRELWTSYEHTHRQHAAQLVRVVDCYSEPMLFLEVGLSAAWDLRHANAPALIALGLTRDSLAGKPFWDLFQEVGSTQQPQEVLDTRVKEEFTLPCLACLQGNVGNTYTAVFRPALLGEDSSLPLGSKTPKDPLVSAGRYFYFVGLSDNARRGVVTQEPTPFEGLELGCLLGKGSFGRVYRGVWQGRDVAVKVCDASAVRLKDGVPIEAVITQNMSHPNVVMTLTHACVSPDDLAEQLSREHRASSGVEAGLVLAPQGPPEGAVRATAELEDQELWLMLEYCDRGSLNDAVTKGMLLGSAPSSLLALLTTGQEIASAMAFLHNHSVIHGDLTGGNVLLASCSHNAHGFMAKVADFGLARELSLTSRVVTRTTGTITHMPPELLSNGFLSKEGDVYAFGVLLWEMHEGRKAWAGLTHAQVMLEVGLKGRSLSLRACALPGLASLLQRCMDRQRLSRPTFAELALELQGLQEVQRRKLEDKREAPERKSGSCPDFGPSLKTMTKRMSETGRVPPLPPLPPPARAVS